MTKYLRPYLINKDQTNNIMKNSIELLKDLKIDIPDKIAEFANSGCDSLAEYLSELENEIKEQAEKLADQVDAEIAWQIREGSSSKATDLEELIITLESL